MIIDMKKFGNIYLIFNLTICKTTFLLFRIEITPKRCYCEHENGGPGKNGIMCGLRASFKRTSECGTNEWCTGPTNETNAVLGSSQLCKKGNRHFYYFVLLSTIISFNKYREHIYIPCNTF